ncbi:hypothetical protein [Domibacillus epiphyticus]|uniref:Uncharacterized protein n=1 Tax=Domibacillus epiphyticus TaxID=1714355 RepID=A0A1V2AA56_9BACI|nr:hypothetical protein [Domibacillus epiphyticus]OMP67878.1 hypothetical protein BTO28_05165 [Domibacillus epiphyticus]
MKKIIFTAIIFTLILALVKPEVNHAQKPVNGKIKNVEAEMYKEIDLFFDKIKVTEKKFESMSNKQQQDFIDSMLSSPEYLKLEKKLATLEPYSKNTSEVRAQALPVLLAPVAAMVGRVAIKAVAKKGTKFAEKYLKGKLNKIGKNYEVSWNVKGRDGSLNSLVVVFQKVGRSKKRVFAVDHTKIPLKPGSSKKIWHFHVTPDVNMHHTMCSFIPSGHKPDTKTKCY